MPLATSPCGNLALRSPHKATALADAAVGSVKQRWSLTQGDAIDR